MDPVATLRRLIEAIIAKEWEEARNALDDLMEWSDSGGFLPDTVLLSVAEEIGATLPDEPERWEPKAGTDKGCMENHDPKDCTFQGYGHCPGCCTDYYIENGQRKKSRVDARKFGLHDYPGAPKPLDGECWTSDCKHGCGCWTGPHNSGGPVDPFGPCPNNPRNIKFIPPPNGVVSGALCPRCDLGCVYPVEKNVGMCDRCNYIFPLTKAEI